MTVTEDILLVLVPGRGEPEAGAQQLWCVRTPPLPSLEDLLLTSLLWPHNSLVIPKWQPSSYLSTFRYHPG